MNSKCSTYATVTMDNINFLACNEQKVLNNDWLHIDLDGLANSLTTNNREVIVSIINKTENVEYYNETFYVDSGNTQLLNLIGDVVLTDNLLLVNELEFANGDIQQYGEIEVKLMFDDGDEEFDCYYSYSLYPNYKIGSVDSLDCSKGIVVDSESNNGVSSVLVIESDGTQSNHSSNSEIVITDQLFEIDIILNTDFVDMGTGLSVETRKNTYIYLELCAILTCYQKMIKDLMCDCDLCSDECNNTEGKKKESLVNRINALIFYTLYNSNYDIYDSVNHPFKSLSTYTSDELEDANDIIENVSELIDRCGVCSGNKEKMNDCGTCNQCD